MVSDRPEGSSSTISDPRFYCWSFLAHLSITSMNVVDRSYWYNLSVNFRFFYSVRISFILETELSVVYIHVWLQRLVYVKTSYSVKKYSLWQFHFKYFLVGQGMWGQYRWFSVCAWFYYRTRLYLKWGQTNVNTISIFGSVESCISLALKRFVTAKEIYDIWQEFITNPT